MTRLATAVVCAAGAALAGPAAGLATAAPVSVTASPKLTPAFQRGVSDYVTRCRAGAPVRLAIEARPGVKVAVDGGTARSGDFERAVSLGRGQATDLVVRGDGGGRRYHLRCLPGDFPRWRFERFGRSQARWFLLAPVGHARSRYVTLIDGNGVPVWWKRQDVIPFNSTLLPNGQLAWGRWYHAKFGMNPSGGWEIHRLDGSLVRTLRTVGTPTDVHDMEPLANGHYLLFSYRLRRGVDLRAFGGAKDGAVFDGEIQELTAAGERVWSWSSRDHVSLAENVGWRGAFETLPDGTEAWDYFHLNSVQPDGGGLIVSARHADAVYRIDRATGDVRWKLGGTHRPESLGVVGDTRKPTFSGQHDARLLPDGTLTVYDNHTIANGKPGRPRAVRFRVDAAAGTATLLEDIREPSLVWSPAEGSARRLPGGDWVVSWGATQLLSEVTAANEPVWRLTLERAQNYRVTPVAPGRLEAPKLRTAMDRMNPRRGQAARRRSR